MKRHKLRNLFKGALRPKSSIPAKHHDDDALTAQASVTPKQASSSLPNASRDSSSVVEKTSCLGSETSLTTDSLSPAADLQTTKCVPSPTQIVPPPPEDAPSLWARAYDVLRSENEELVSRYETLLSRELEDGSSNKHEDESPGRLGNQIDTHPEKRQAQLKAITDEGLRRAEEKRTKYTVFGHEFILRDQVAQAAQFFQAISRLICEAAKASSEASVAWAGVSVLLPLLKNPSVAEIANRDGLSYVTSRIRYYIELEHLLWPENLRESGLKAEFESHIVDLYQHVLEFQIKTVIRFFRRWLSSTSRDMIRHDDWEGMLSKIKGLERIVGDESRTLNTIAARNKVEDMSRAAEQAYTDMRSLLLVAEEQLIEQRRTNEILEDHSIDLPIVHEARLDSTDVQDSPKCEAGTRLRIRETIHRWEDDESAEPLFWMVGPAGTGKSTIARTVAKTLGGENRTVAGYFFKRGDKARCDTRMLFSTLAMQVAEMMPDFRRCLRKSLDGLGREAVEKKALEGQFHVVLYQPLTDLRPIEKGKRRRLLIIIDALDECELVEHYSRVLRLLCNLQQVETVRVRIVLTSRSAPDIVNAFDSLAGKNNIRTLQLHRQFSEDTRIDIRRFLESRFSEIKAKRRVQQDPWPDAEDLDRVVQLATTPEPLFIYAATLCRFVCDERNPRNPKTQLKLWLKQSGENKPQLDQIYDPILGQVFQNNDNAESSQQLQFLGALVLLATPLSAASLASLLDTDIDDVNWWLPELHAVLDIPTGTDDPIRLLHKSFSDFLLRPANTESTANRVDAKEIHTMLATKCIQRMQRGLKQDICDLGKAGTPKDAIDQRTIDAHIPADLRYA
ncbi:vegetative incompatibility protein het-e-1, partial [Colletotrichum musicola]